MATKEEIESLIKIIEEGLGRLLEKSGGYEKEIESLKRQNKELQAKYVETLEKIEKYLSEFEELKKYYVDNKDKPKQQSF